MATKGSATSPAFWKYLDEIWAAFLDAKDAPEGDPYDYMAAAERGLKIEALNEKFDPLMKLLLQNGLSSEQVSALMAKTFPQEEADQLTATITNEFLSIADKAMNNLVLARKLPRSSVTLARGWKDLPEETKKEQIAEAIQGMLDGKYFDRGVFTTYATPEQQSAIAKKLLSPDQIRSTYITIMNRTLVYRSKERDRLQVYRYLPEVKPDLLHQAAYQDIRDAVSLTVSGSGKLPERLEALTGILKDPDHFQKRVSDFVIAAKQERKTDAPQKKTKRGPGKPNL